MERLGAIPVSSATVGDGAPLAGGGGSRRRPSSVASSVTRLRGTFARMAGEGRVRLSVHAFLGGVEGQDLISVS